MKPCGEYSPLTIFAPLMSMTCEYAADWRATSRKLFAIEPQPLGEDETLGKHEAVRNRGYD